MFLNSYFYNKLQITTKTGKLIKNRNQSFLINKIILQISFFPLKMELYLKK